MSFEDLSDDGFEGSQMEVPYKMNFSDHEDNNKIRKAYPRKHSKSNNSGSDSDSESDSSSSTCSSDDCASFDSRPDTRREPLRVGDVIEFTPAVFTSGTRLKQAQVLGIWPSEKFPLVLDTMDLLQNDHHIQRVGEFYRKKVYKHSGITKPMENFDLKQGGTKEITTALQLQSKQYKASIQKVKDVALKFMRGEMTLSTSKNSISNSNQPPSSSVSSSSSHPSIKCKQTQYSKFAAAAVAMKDEVDISSTSSCSIPPEIKYRYKTPILTNKRTQKNRLGLTKTNHSKSHFSNTTTNKYRPRQEEAFTASSSSSRTASVSHETTTLTRPIKKMSTKSNLKDWRSYNSIERNQTNRRQTPPSKSGANNKSQALNKVSSSSHVTGILKEHRQESKSQPPDMSSSSSEDVDDAKNLVPVHVTTMLKHQRRQRQSLPHSQSCYWSGSEEGSTPMWLAKKTLQRTSVLEHLEDEDMGKADLSWLPSLKRSKQQAFKHTSKQASYNISTGINQFTAKAESTPNPKANLKLRPSNHQTRKQIDTSISTSSSEEEKLSSTWKEYSKLRKIKKGQSTPTHKRRGATSIDPTTMPFSSSEDDVNDVFFRELVFSKKKRSSKKVDAYDADPEEEEKDPWRLQSPPTRKRRLLSPPKSPNNTSRLRLVQDIHNNRASTKKQMKQRQHVLPDDSFSSFEDYSKQKQGHSHSQWSTDCEVDSPSPSPPSRIHSNQPKKKREMKYDLDFSSHDENEDGNYESTKKKRLDNSSRQKKHN